MQGTQITFVGNLTDDPDLSFTPSGIAVCNFRVAVNNRVQRNDEWVDGEPTFYRVAAFRDYAENAADTLAKGMSVLIVGKLKTRTWEGQDGQKRLDLDVTVDDMGPALRWATAKVQKVRRGDPDPARASRPQGQDAQPSKGGSFDEQPAPF
jgi:single-strand DNA-binding protein